MEDPGRRTAGDICRLLALCCRPQPDAETARRLRRAAERLSSWDALPIYAQHLEVAPLAYARLRELGIQLPAATRNALAGDYLRHRHANGVRFGALAEILAAFAGHGIDALLLKGCALAHRVYPEPGLRPMVDLDLLVAPADTAAARQVLRGLGFTAPADYLADPHPHQAPAVRFEDGVLVVVEIHRRLSSGERQELADLVPAATPLTIQGVPARTLGYEDMLFHLHHHLVRHLFFHARLRLKWVGDLIGWAETHLDAIDWDDLARRHPRVPGALAALDPLCPLAPRLRAVLGVEPGAEPAGILEELPGPLPRRTISPGARPPRLRDRTRSPFEVLFPSPWRLRLTLGVAAGADGAWRRALFPLEVVRFGAEIARSRRWEMRAMKGLLAPWIRRAQR